MAAYAPGACNIGRRGRLARGTFGVIAIAFAFAVWWVLRASGAPAAWRLLLFLPLFAGFVAIFEAALRFCVVLATRGVYDLR